MKSVAWWIALIVLLASAGEWQALHRHDPVIVELRAESSQWTTLQRGEQIRLDERSKAVARIRVRQSGWTWAGFVTIRGSGGELFALLPGQYAPRLLGASRDDCNALSDGTFSCRIQASLAANEALTVHATAGTVGVVGLSTETVRASVVPSAQFRAVLALFAFVVAVALIARSLALVPVVRASLLAVVAAVWLIATAGWGGFALLVVVVGSFGWLQGLARGSRSTGALVLALSSVGLGLLAVRWAAQGTWIPTGSTVAASLFLPLGVAFVAVRLADVVMRISTGQLKSLRFTEYATWMLFPPTLAAGPLLTLPEWRARQASATTLTDWGAGGARMLVGLAKKLGSELVLRAAGMWGFDAAAVPDVDSGWRLWVALLAVAIHVYLDFSGYSDLAIGAGRVCGVRVPENFDHPFMKSTLRDFWRAWHMSLTNWTSRWVHALAAAALRREAPIIQGWVPVLISLLLIGMWHGATLRWMLWGLHHAAGILVGEAVARSSLATKLAQRSGAAVAKVIGQSYVLAWVSLSHCFTVTTDPIRAIELWLSALSLGVL